MNLSSSKADQVRVWDPLVRIFHWSLVAGFTTAYFVEDDRLALHVQAGYLVLILVAIRVIWGLIGSRHARFGDFVRGPATILHYLNDLLRGQAERYLGHNPAGGAMIVLLLLAVTATGVSGLFLYGVQELSGPLAGWVSGFPPAMAHELEEVHEFCANLTLGLIGIHIGGVIVASLLHRENLIAAMISGRKRSHLS